MLKNIDKVLSPQLLKVLAEMGHADEITLADANFPGKTYGKIVLRLDGVEIPVLLDAILQLVPLDTYVTHPVILMAVPPENPVNTPIWEEYKKIVTKHDERGESCFEEIERFAFYKRVSEQSHAVIMTGETALNANIILKKGIVI